MAADSPASSPCKGPLVDNDDEESPSFRAKSFYGRKKKIPRTVPLPQSGINEEKPGSPVPSAASSSNASTENLTRAPLRRTRSSVGNISTDGEEMAVMSPRVVLSPIKNIHGNIKKQPKAKVKKASVTRKRGKSLPARVQPVIQASIPPAPQAAKPSDEDAPVDATPPNNRKFFKHKSPASASRVVGGIIVRKGFNLKFVRGLLTKDFSQSPGKRTGPAEKQRSTPKVQKTYSRKIGKPAVEAGTGAKTASPMDGSRSSGSRGHVSGENSWTMDIPMPAPSSPRVEDSMVSGEGSAEPGSQNLFNSDTQSTENCLPPASSSQPQSAVSSQDDSQDKFYSIFSQKRHSQRLAAAECT